MVLNKGLYKGLYQRGRTNPEVNFHMLFPFNNTFSCYKIMIMIVKNIAEA